MKTVQVQFPEHTAVLDFVRRNQLELIERFQHEDIEWALAQKRRPA